MIATVTKAEIHSGESTHTQDQLMIPSSLNATNRIVNAPAKPMPDEDELDDSAIKLVVENRWAQPEVPDDESDNEDDYAGDAFWSHSLTNNSQGLLGRFATY